MKTRETQIHTLNVHLGEREGILCISSEITFGTQLQGDAYTIYMQYSLFHKLKVASQMSSFIICFRASPSDEGYYLWSTPKYVVSIPHTSRSVYLWASISKITAKLQRNQAYFTKLHDFNVQVIFRLYCMRGYPIYVIMQGKAYSVEHRYVLERMRWDWW